MNVWCNNCAGYHESLTICPAALSGNMTPSIAVPSGVEQPRCQQDRKHDDMGCEVAWEQHCDRHRRETRELAQKLDTMTQARVGDIKEIERLIRERGILAGERDGYRLQAECMTRERDGFCEAFKASEKERHDALLQKEAKEQKLHRICQLIEAVPCICRQLPTFQQCKRCRIIELLAGEPGSSFTRNGLGRVVCGCVGESTCDFCRAAKSAETRVESFSTGCKIPGCQQHQEAPQKGADKRFDRCESYWDGQQCELEANHATEKHHAVGHWWIVGKV